MYFNAPGNPSKVKKLVYLSAFVFLGLILSFVAHGIIEMAYLRWADSRQLLVPFYGGCALPPLLQTIIWLAGGAGGYFLGRFGWRKIYVERVREKVKANNWPVKV